MMRSLYSGISGLRNHQTRMDVIANNIANVNTAGYVASRVVFKDVFSQTSKYASASTDAIGGTNPIQIGLGMSLATIDMLHGGGAAFARSDRELDFMIQGEGFFIIDINNTLGELRYSRAGNFYWDNAGNLVNGDGHYVMGMMVEEKYDSTTDVREDYDPLTDTLAVITTTDPATGKALYKDMFIDDNGLIIGTALEAGTGYVAGDKVTIGYLVLATFNNNNGLEKVGNSLYKESNNSGEAAFSVAGVDGAGTLLAGGLEMSNVDLASEFTDMIVTQRGFQANSRIITTSDSILEELVNLKR